MIISSEPFKKPVSGDPERDPGLKPHPDASVTAYDQADTFLREVQGVLDDNSAALGVDPLLLQYQALKDAYEATGRDFGNADLALAAGTVTAERILTNALYVWPLKGLGQPSWPNARY